jgi:hypothetical protein
MFRSILYRLQDAGWQDTGVLSMTLGRGMLLSTIDMLPDTGMMIVPKIEFAFSDL